MPGENQLPPFELRHLVHLVALEEHGTLHAAAGALHLSQSALTKSIAALEDALGSPLFDRSGRRLRPNALHGRVLARARAMLAAAGDLEREAALHREQHLDELQIGVGPVVALGPLPAALARFRALAPDVRVVVRVAATEELAPALVAGRLHLVVADWEQRTDGEFDVETLGPDPIAGAVRPGHPLAALGERATLPDLFSYPRAGATPPPRMRRFVEEMLGPGRGLTADVLCDNYEVLTALAEASDTIVLGPRSVLDRYAAQGRLVALPVAYPSPPSEPGILLAAGRPVPPAVRLLADVFLSRA
ncbi:MAG: LysR family transcriptional regulator [Myxococcales bacterium]|nr:LysR family transcriptional regulator [Myxococcales bacterium]